MVKLSLLLLLWLVPVSPLRAAPQSGIRSPQSDAPMPPKIPWSGASEDLIARPDDPWVTPAEKSGFQTSPPYAETLEWLGRLDKASPEIRIIAIGKSEEGREIPMVIASRNRSLAPGTPRSSARPRLMVQAGIHSGEIDGKDAGMMLLRDLTAGGRKKDLLEKADLLFVPILNPDGHEKSSAYNRINQRGPETMGWRTNGQNLNLNRDYGKLDSSEIRAIVRVIEEWQPDLYVDVHVTDGADYQYDITYGFNNKNAHSPSIAAWLGNVLTPWVNGSLAGMGHIPGPLIFTISDDVKQGLFGGNAGLRFSNGYGDARHLPAVLVENHSLKPFRQRVLGTYVLLESILQLLGEQGMQLRNEVGKDQRLRREAVPLGWKRAEAITADFAGIGYRMVKSPVSGGEVVQWTGEKIQMQVPRTEITVPDLLIKRPRAYWIPPAWHSVVDRLRLHGIRTESLQGDREVELTSYRVQDYKLETRASEGHVPVTATFSEERRRIKTTAGWVRVPTDQPLGDLAILLLEPGSPESFFQWGFFSAILREPEYFEGYILEPLARQMLERNPALKAEFEKTLAEDREFASSAERRLRWFYTRSPYFQNQVRYYPVARE